MNLEIEGMKPRVLVVLGMHRSGTSVLSAGLEALGVEFGDNLIPARADNPKGYWEDARLVELNEEILAACGFSSGDIGLSDGRVSDPAHFGDWVRRAGLLLEELLVGKSLLGIKDPRMPRLMPIWQAAFDALGLRVDYVIAARHPLSVAASLAARDQLSQEKSLLLWYEHSCRAIQWALCRGAVVADYDQLLATPWEELSRIGQRLSLQLDEPGFARFTEEVLDVGLRHSSHDEEELAAARGSFPGLIEVHGAMQHLAVDRFDPAQWVGLEGDFVRSMPFLEFAGELDRQLWQLAALRIEERQRYEEQVKHLTAMGDGQRQRNEELVEQMHRSTLEFEARIEANERAGQMLSQQLSVCRDELASARQGLTELRASLASQEGQLQCVQMDLQYARAHLVAMQGSHSWRCTRPLRTVGSLLRRLAGAKRS
ncbi:hypothetical protein D9M68_142010 [compost metagenome]